MKKDSFSEKRQYTRLTSVLSVDFTIVRLQGNLPGLDWQKGTVRDVSKDGVGLQTDELDESTIKYLASEHIYLDLCISLPLSSHPIKAVAQVAWYTKIDESDSKKYLIGLKFSSIIEGDLKKILRLAPYTKFFSWFMK